MASEDLRCTVSVFSKWRNDGPFDFAEYKIAVRDKVQQITCGISDIVSSRFNSFANSIAESLIELHPEDDGVPLSEQRRFNRSGWAQFSTKYITSIENIVSAEVDSLRQELPDLRGVLWIGFDGSVSALRALHDCSKISCGDGRSEVIHSFLSDVGGDVVVDAIESMEIGHPDNVCVNGGAMWSWKLERTFVVASCLELSALDLMDSLLALKSMYLSNDLLIGSHLRVYCEESSMLFAWLEEQDLLECWNTPFVSPVHSVSSQHLYVSRAAFLFLGLVGADVHDFLLSQVLSEAAIDDAVILGLFLSDIYCHDWVLVFPRELKCLGDWICAQTEQSIGNHRLRLVCVDRAIGSYDASSVEGMSAASRRRRRCGLLFNLARDHEVSGSCSTLVDIVGASSVVSCSLYGSFQWWSLVLLAIGYAWSTSVVNRTRTAIVDKRMTALRETVVQGRGSLPRDAAGRQLCPMYSRWSKLGFQTRFSIAFGGVVVDFRGAMRSNMAEIMAICERFIGTIMWDTVTPAKMCAALFLAPTQPPFCRSCVELICSHPSICDGAERETAMLLERLSISSRSCGAGADLKSRMEQLLGCRNEEIIILFEPIAVEEGQRQPIHGGCSKAELTSLRMSALFDELMELGRYVLFVGCSSREQGRTAMADIRSEVENLLDQALAQKIH